MPAMVENPTTPGVETPEFKRFSHDLIRFNAQSETLTAYGMAWAQSNRQLRRKHFSYFTCQITNVRPAFDDVIRAVEMGDWSATDRILILGTILVADTTQRYQQFKDVAPDAQLDDPLLTKLALYSDPDLPDNESSPGEVRDFFKAKFRNRLEADYREFRSAVEQQRALRRQRVGHILETAGALGIGLSFLGAAIEHSFVNPWQSSYR